MVGAAVSVSRPDHRNHDAMVAFCAFPEGSNLEKVEGTLDARAGGNAYARHAAEHVHWGKSSADKAYQLKHDAVMVGVWSCPLGDAYEADDKVFRSEYAMLCSFDGLERPAPTTCDTPGAFRPTYGKERVPPEQYLAQTRWRSRSLDTRNLIDRTITAKPEDRQKTWDDAKPIIPTCFENEDFSFDCNLSRTLGSTQTVPATPVYHRPPAVRGYGGSGGYAMPYRAYPVE